jgi:hypothetical protein
MRYAFDTLANVQFSHSYFSDNVFSGLTVNVPASTRGVLNNLGLLVKPFKGGFYVLYDQNFGGNPRTRDEVLNENIRLEFTLSLNDPYFYSCTSGLPGQIAGSIYYFHNALKALSAWPESSLLHALEFVSESDVYVFKYFKAPFFNKPFAKLDLNIQPGIANEYFIRFKARATRWRYILMSDHLQDLKGPTILVNGDSGVFDTVSKIKLPDNRDVIYFVSKEELSLSQYATSTFQLVESNGTDPSRYRVIIRALPVPDIRLISRIPIPPPPGNSPADGEPGSPAALNQNNYSDILIH